MNNLANIITGLSLFFGFSSVIFSLERHFTFAAWAIILSVFLDGIDGTVARITGATSEFGKELDSLVDVVSFGVAPSILGYIFVYHTFHLWATLALFTYLACSVARLAKYNITPKESLAKYFYGLPTTASGGVLASFILLHREYARLPSQALFLAVVLILAFLMVSKVRYPNLDGLRQLFGKLLLPAGALFLVCGVFCAEISLLVVFFSYLIFSPFCVKKLA